MKRGGVFVDGGRVAKVMNKIETKENGPPKKKHGRAEK